MKKLLSVIAFLFRTVWNLLSFMRSAIVNLIILVIAGLLFFSFFQSREVELTDNSVLKLTIAGSIVEQKSEKDPISELFSEFFGVSTPVQETLLQDILDIISRAEEDDKIRAILLDLSSMGSGGLNQLAEIGEQLELFRLSGKKVIAAEDYYNQNQYYLASYADRIFLNPMGAVYLSGFGSYRLYFRDAIEKLKINYHVFKVGSFKSALEPLTRNSMSAEDRYQSRVWLTALWNNYVKDVAGQRGIAPQAVYNYINRIPENLRDAEGSLAELALASNLVDEIKPRHEIRAYLATLSGGNMEDGFRNISTEKYLKTVQRSYRYQGSDMDTVALLVAQGTIIPGKSKPGAIGADTIATLLRKAAKSPTIKAVVLRVNSGGGSAFASEVIRQEILQLKTQGKPLVVSMGSVAASGAYWISADADQIFASANTLTGSIGIFMAIPTFESSLSSLGIYRDGVGTTNLAGGLSLTSPISPELKQAIQLTLDHGYKTFLTVVSQGRSLPLDDMESVAGGRIFDGATAIESGLVDKLGSLSDAIRSAAELAGLDIYRVTTLQQADSLQHWLFSMIGTDSISSVLENLSPSTLLNTLIPVTEDLQRLLLFRDPNGMYAHCVINYY